MTGQAQIGNLVGLKVYNPKVRQHALSCEDSAVLKLLNDSNMYKPSDIKDRSIARWYFLANGTAAFSSFLNPDSKSTGAGFDLVAGSPSSTRGS